jgi:hypothetical protein
MATKRAAAPAGLSEAKKRLSTKQEATEALESATPAKEWKKRTKEGLYVRVPSGNTAYIRTPGMEVFLERGLIPNALLPLITDSLNRGGPPKDEDLAGLLKDQEKLQEIIDLANGITVYCCIDPVVEPIPLYDDGSIIPIGSSDRDEDLLYVDEVDFNDKMFILGVATGGIEALERFREEQGLDVGVVQ